MTEQVTPCWRGRWRAGQVIAPSIIPIGPRHAHFPPGYPILLALVWSVSGPSAPLAALLVSFVRGGGNAGGLVVVPQDLPAEMTALVLGLALAVNWAWARTAIGDPIGASLHAARPGDDRRRVSAAAGQVASVGRLVLGGLLAACLLTRQVAIGLVLAVMLDLGLRRPRWPAVAVGATAMVLVAPWLAWLLVVGAEQRTQANMLIAPDRRGLLGGSVSQAAFYVQRIPDQITGPFVEVATVIRPTAGTRSGWRTCGPLRPLGRRARAAGSSRFGSPRRRLAGLIPL